MPSSVGPGTAVTFSVNDEPHKVLNRQSPEDGFSGDVSATTSLADYLRFHRHMPGTKTMCREGGCGACVVSVKFPNPATGQLETRAVNSCLVPLHVCQDWEVKTVEGIGDRRSGYHPVQVRLAQLNGTQCGYCSPGMVMSMYSLLNSKDQVTKADVEQYMDGNLCRCTGYRPILDAFKTFGQDTDAKTKQMVKDIEEAVGCRREGSPCAAEAGGPDGARCRGCPRALPMSSSQANWSLPDNLQKLYTDMASVHRGKTLRLVTGNTGAGVYKYEGPFDSYISLLKIPELSQVSRSEAAVKFGAAVTLSALVGELQSLGATAGYRHCSQMASHLLLVANTPVRNMGSWAGNLMIKYHHRDFPSDVFLLLTTARATIDVADSKGAVMKMPVEKLFEIDMDRKAILSMTLPALDDNKHILKSYKITPRAVSAHAYVNAAFLFQVDKTRYTITEKPTVLYGGISEGFVHAKSTEEYLTGKSLLDPATLKGALRTLEGEVQPTADPELASVQYRKQLTASLLYKVILHVLGDRVPARLRSGGADLTRPPNTGSQEFDTDKSLWPVNKPIPKLEAQAQTSGEAEYVNDQEPLADEVYGHFVISSVAKAKLGTVDASAALAMEGVHAFYTAKDVIGNNRIKGEKLPEELFVSDKVEYCGQPIGLIVADSLELARRAAALVRVQYTNVEKPVLTIKEALKQGQEVKPDTMFHVELKTGNSDEGIAGARHQLSGEFEIGGQYHFYMETQVTRAVPCEDDQINIFCATQDAKDVLETVSNVIRMPANRVNVEVRRLGGGYGGKLSYASPVAAGAALAAVKLNRPVRIVLDIEDNMEMFGGRLPYLIKYKVGVDDDAKIRGLSMRYICDSGFSSGATTGFGAVHVAQNVYEAQNWNIVPGHVNTNLAPNTWCRAPGTTQGISGIEHVMDRIAHQLNIDPWEVRKANFFTPQTTFTFSSNPESDSSVFKMMIDEMYAKGDIVKRKADIEKFNKENRWRKRCLSLLPMKYVVHLWAKYPALISIYEKDGTVSVSVGGIEMGQGLNTKVAQVCAHQLGVPVDMVSVKPSNSLISPNASPTGGSIGSEMAAMAAKEACEVLKQRLKPFQAEDKAWVKVVADASQAQVNLTAHTMSKHTPETYNVFGLTAAELELDVLTGESRVNRVDLYEDAGQSLSPWVDIGQLEGAFVMGMGLFLTELHRFDQDSGRRLTHRTWNYYVPTLRDIPRDFRVKLLNNNRNEVGIFNSKATGEPPLCMTSVCLAALRGAISQARRDAGKTDWFQLDAPGTVERSQLACGTTADMFVLG